MSTNSLIDPSLPRPRGDQPYSLLNGPNLIQVGQREAEITDRPLPSPPTWSNSLVRPPRRQLRHRYSHYEGALINYLYMAQEQGYQAVILNAGGYAHLRSSSRCVAPLRTTSHRGAHLPATSP